MVSLDNSWGTFLLGTYFGIMLCVLTAHQAYRYFRRSFSGSVFSKSVVYPVLAFEAMHTMLCMHIGYTYLATHRDGNPVELGNGVWSVEMITLFAASVIMSSQLFFVRRLYLFSPKYKWVVYVAVLLLVIELGLLAAATSAAFIQETSLTEYTGHVTWFLSAGFWTAAVADIILTPALIIIVRSSGTAAVAEIVLPTALMTHLRSSGTSAAADIILPIALVITVRSSLILYAITTGLFTTVFNVFTFLVALIYTDNLIYIGFDIVASKRELNPRHSVSDRSSGISTVYGANSSTGSLNDSMQVRGETVPDLVGVPPRKSDHHLDRAAKGGGGGFVTAATV